MVFASEGALADGAMETFVLGVNQQMPFKFKAGSELFVALFLGTLERRLARVNVTILLKFSGRRKSFFAFGTKMEFASAAAAKAAAGGRVKRGR